MKILIVAATEIEVQFLLKEEWANKVDVLVTGIGATFTAFALTQKLMQQNYDMVLNVGIAGSFDAAISHGDVVQVVQEEFADLAYETQTGYESFFDSGFIDGNKTPFVDGGKLIATPPNQIQELLQSVKKAKGITVNKVHGTAESIALVEKKYAPQIESMEGAAVFYVCKQMNVPAVQLRSVSNKVEPRNKEAWNIPLAIKNLHAKTTELLVQLQGQGSEK